MGFDDGNFQEAPEKAEYEAWEKVNTAATNRAAQLWCLPAFSSREMDAPFAEAIAATIREAVEEERQRCHNIVNRVGLENWGPKDALKLIDEGSL